jgi:hypothetical protein
MSVSLFVTAVLATVQPGVSSNSRDNLATLDRRVILPAAARPKDDYVRFYAPMSIRTADDLPFTTMLDVPLKPGRVLVAVFVIPGEWGVPGPEGIRQVGNASSLPHVVHGGCRAVNVIMDPDSGRTLASWCNVDEDLPPGPPPPGAPSQAYIPSGSR